MFMIYFFGKYETMHEQVIIITNCLKKEKEINDA